MNWLKKAAEVAFNTVNVAWYARNGYPQLFQLLGGGTPSFTGESITVERAMQCSVVNVCTRMICDSLASMPLNLHQHTSDGGTKLLKDTPLYRVLKLAPNPYQTPRVFRRTLSHHALNYGNGFARIARRGNAGGGEVIGLYILHPYQVEIRFEESGAPVYLYRTKGKGEERLSDAQIFHLSNQSDDGFTGAGAVDQGRHPIALYLALEQYGARFFARGGMGAGMLQKHVPFMNDQARQQFREDLQKEYAGMENAHKTIITEGEWDFKPFATDPQKSQFIELRQQMIPEICRYYGITPHLAQDLSRAHFANVEGLGQEFVTYTLGSWMVGWEEEIYRSLLTKSQQEKGVYAKHNANALLRGDFEKRWKGYATALQNGVKSINEVRSLEDDDPIDGGDAHHIQLNMQTVAGTGEPTVSEQAQLIKISAGRRSQ